MEESLVERDLKRKQTEEPKNRKAKRRKLEVLTGWGESTSHQGILRSEETLSEGWRVSERYELLGTPPQ